MFILSKKNIFFLITFSIIISAFFRFYSLSWGAPFYFHPDERNIASSVIQLSFPSQMNPHFFAYGSLPIYTIYFTGVLINFLTHFPTLNSITPRNLGEVESIFTVSFEQAIIISRFFSAFFSLALIPLLFFVGKKLKNKQTGLIIALLTSASVGLIQFAHFGTFEMWLTFFSLLLFMLCLKIIEKKGFFLTVLVGLVFGILLATKVTHITLLPIPLLVIIIKQIHKKKSGIRYLNLIKDILLFFLITILVFIITNPFVLLDYSSFYSSMKYESEVALGTLPVFYTGEFVNAVPVVFQFIYIYPFLLNPLMTIIFIPSFFYLIFLSIKTKNQAYIILNIFYIILFLSQAFLYVKWTRYIVPTLPFIYLICAIALVDFWRLLSIKCVIFFKYFLLSVFIYTNILFAASYFITAFIQKDTRFAAKNFAKQNIPLNASILSEVYDLGITPFNDSFRNINLFNFYDLDNNSSEYTPNTLAQKIAVSDYIILPSQRILKTRLQQAKSYPNGHAFYSALLAQANGFQKIYETPCDIFCKITYMGSPVYSFEETVNVFDRPSIFIFKKISNL